MIDVVWMSLHEDRPCRNYWDMALLDDMLKDERRYRHHEGYDFSGMNGAIVVLPARYHSQDVDVINKLIAPLEFVLFILVGDEGEIFPSQNLSHPNMIVWQQSPHLHQHGNVDRYIPLGYSTGTREYLKEARSGQIVPSNDWFFAGQNTHIRRQLCVDALKHRNLRDTGELLETEGFTQGFERKEYFARMANTMTAPCPSGVVVLDTFRMYEALEAGCLPIVDGIDPLGGSWGYWHFLFGENPPFPVLREWPEVIGSINSAVAEFPVPQNRVFAWWQLKKYGMRQDLLEDLHTLGVTNYDLGADNGDVVNRNITVLVPTSPIESHPDTAIIEQTIASVRHHLPDAEILIMIDGVRPEQLHRRDDYNEYVRRLLWKCNFEWEHVTPLLFDEFSHQTKMCREALRYVRRGDHSGNAQILYVEHDAPLVTDYEIEWADLWAFLVSGKANTVRFHHEAQVLEVHEHLMLDSEPVEIAPNVFAKRTAQWSQRPHLARADFYDRILAKYFSVDALAMIEDGLYGVLATGFQEGGKPSWNEFKSWLYHPIDGNIKRSYTTDGRGSEEKYSQSF
jgi:hypothetical protein